MNPYQYDQMRWRKDRYWNEPCDNLYKAFEPLFKYVWTTFSGKKMRPGQKLLMGVDEFHDLMETAGLVNDLLKERELSICFVMGL